MNDATKQWLESLIKAGSLSPEQRKALEEIASKPEIDSLIKDSTMMRSDYSRAQDKLKADLAAETAKVQAEYQQKIEGIRKYQQDLANFEGKTKKEVEDAKAAYARTEQALQHYKDSLAQVKAKALAGTLTEADLEITTPMSTPSQPPSSQVPAISPSEPQKRALTEEDVPAYLLRSAEIQAALADLAQDHQALFKEPLRLTQLFKDATAAGKPVLDFYNEKYQPEVKKREIYEQSVEAKYQAKLEEQLTAWKSQNPLAAPAPEREAFRPLVEALKEQFRPPTQATEYQDAVAAAEALRSGKYIGQSM